MIANYTEIVMVIEKIIKQNWHNLFSGKPIPDKLIYKQKTGFRKRIIFIYHCSTKELLALAHIVEDPNLESRLRNHYNSLNTIHNSDDNYLKTTVTSPIYFSVESEYLLFIQKALRGKTLTRRARSCLFLSKRKLEKDLEIAVEWLLKLNTCFTTNRVKVKHTILNQMALRNSILIEMYDKVKEYEIPLVLEHKDFTTNNLLYEGEKLSVIDWEYSMMGGLPLWDLVLCLITTYKTVYCFMSSISPFSISKHPTGRDLEEIFFKDCYYSGLIKKFVWEYCKKMNLNKEVGEFLMFTKVKDYMNSNNINWNFKEYKPGSFLS